MKSINPDLPTKEDKQTILEFLDYNPFRGIYNLPHEYKQISTTISGRRPHTVIMDDIVRQSHNQFMHSTRRKHSKLFYEAQEQLFREYPVFHAGLVEYEESLEMMEYVINEDKVDFGLVFMFHCFNILLEDESGLDKLGV